MKNKPLISVIVTTYNRLDALGAVLRSLQDQTDENFEVIIADDGSSASTRDMVRSFQQSPLPPGYKRLVHTWQPHDGFRASAARNMGVCASQGDYLIFLDGDCIPRPSFIERHRLFAEPGFIVSGSRVILSEKYTKELLSTTQPPDVSGKGIAYWFMQRLLGNANKVLPLINLPDSTFRHYRAVKWNRIKSCNLAMWKNDFAMVNGFDESFVGWGHEDADLVLRLARSGIRRKGGAFSTEVFHLWHRENARAAESENRHRVEERIKNGLVKVVVGLNNHPKDDTRIY